MSPRKYLELSEMLVANHWLLSNNRMGCRVVKCKLWNLTQR